AYAAHRDAFHQLRFYAGPDDQLGRPSANINHQSPLGGGGEAVSHAEVDQTSFLPAEYHFDVKSQRRLGFGAKRLRVLVDAQCARAYRAHRRRGEAAKTLCEARQRLQRPGLGKLVDAAVPRKPRSQANRIAQAVQQIDLIVDDPADLQVEAVGSQVERGQ